MIKQLTRRPGNDETLAMALFVVSAIVALWKGAAPTLMAGIAAFLIVIGLRPRAMLFAFLAGALTMILFIPSVSSATAEGFEDASGDVDVSGAGEKEGFAGDDAPAPIAPKKPMVPDNRERQEMLELGKPYKLPSEKDDVGVHLDAGTTFLNAYKALKPDQIASMTRDTQELIATQKSLVAMLDSFGPMLKDMNKITGFFNAS